jgi:hypothetical protein
MPLSKGYKHSEETKKKMSLSHKGEKNHFFGKKHSDEAKKKISIANSGEKHKFFGKKRPKDMCRLISEKESGSKHWNWKGGLTALHERIRKSFKYRQWRSDVFTRDNYTCQHCLIRGGDLEAHHIDRLSDTLEKNKIKSIEEAVNCEELWNINNGITLCDSCHIEHHKNL